MVRPNTMSVPKMASGRSDMVHLPLTFLRCSLSTLHLEQIFEPIRAVALSTGFLQMRHLLCFAIMFSLSHRTKSGLSIKIVPWIRFPVFLDQSFSPMLPHM